MKSKARKGEVDYRAVVENVEIAWIPMSDGRKLAARLLLPRDPQARPVPAILEYIPYRRRDGTRVRDDDTHYWYAANGFASARVDISGSGDSEGLVEDEYVKREQDDAVEIIAWLAKQPWCTGSVGMIGISWGGFNGLQVAARRPPALKAVVSLCSTVDRYHDDVHFMGGCLLNDTMDWGGYFFQILGLPPDPEIVGEKTWRKMWKHRIDNMENPVATWMEHQTRDAFWKHGSVIEDYSKINVPVMNASGWVDGYTTAVFRTVENMGPNSKGIAGPWGHKYPHHGVPGPAIGFLQETKRFFDRWLKGDRNGAESDPAMRVYAQDSIKPKPHHDHRPGRWIGFDQWPSPNIKTQKLYLSGAELTKSAPRKNMELRSVSSPLTTGLASGEWCAYGLGKIAPELALDQRADDAGSLCWDGPVLEEPMTIVGGPVVKLRVSADKPQAHICVRLNTIHPDGTSERITYGLLNLSHRDSHEKPKPLKKGQSYDVTVQLDEIAQTVPAGHRLRIAVSTSYFPMTWPDPEMTTVTVDGAGSLLEVPVLVSEKGLPKVRFEPPVHAPSAPLTIKDPGGETREIHHDISTERTTFRHARNDGTFVIDDIGTSVSLTKTKEFSVTRDDPASARSRVHCSTHYKRGSWDARAESEIVLTSDKTHFHLEGWHRTWDAGKPFAERKFKRSYKRDHL